MCMDDITWQEELQWRFVQSQNCLTDYSYCQMANLV